MEAPARSPIRVLLVDDDEDMLVLVRAWLEDVESGRYEVDWAPSAADARRIIGDDRYDAYLIDYRLGAESGIDLLREVAGALPDRPAILMTGQGGRSVDRDALEAGATEYVQKCAASAETLERAIRYAMAQKCAQRLERERRSAQEAARAMERVLAVVAHELRTPLTSLRLMSEYLLAPDSRGGPELERFLASIHGETLRMTETVNNVLEAARFDSGLARWNWGTVRVADAVEQALETVRPQVDRSAVEVVSSVEPEDLTMLGDADAIRRLVMNLASNAAKHTRAGRIEVLATGAAEAGQPCVRIEVRDTGSGMPQSVVRRLGTAFALNSGIVGSAASHGTGLGLAICKGIAASHGGTVRVLSSEGEGSRIVVMMRADLDAPAAVAEGVQIIREAA
ncbi:MAG: hybrid sensor histidine kinase/response regulator [Phycisphaerales bacterium]|nr:hybrid sensor histidine kinase/response regulator [Phycisphaerales bacterium]